VSCQTLAQRVKHKNVKAGQLPAKDSVLFRVAIQLAFPEADGHTARSSYRSHHRNCLSIIALKHNRIDCGGLLWHVAADMAYITLQQEIRSCFNAL